MSTPSSNALERLGPVVEKALRDSLGDNKTLLNEMARHHLGQGPSDHPHGVLCLLAGALASHAPVRAAVAIELLRAAREIHDDLRLGNPQRGYKPAVWWAFGHAQAINAGDGLYAQARLALMDAGDISDEEVLRCLAVLDRAWLSLATAAHGEIESEAAESWTLQQHLAAVEGSDGSLMAAAAGLGASAGKRDVEALEAFGKHVGIALRLRQEVDALWGSVEPEGLLEVLDKQRSAPLLYALERGTAEQRRTLKAAAIREQPLDDARAAEVRRSLDEAGGKAFAEALAEEHLAKALAALRTLPGDTSELEGFARQVAGENSIPSG